MSTQAVIAILLTVTAVASYINYRFIKLPSTIGLTLITLLASIIFITLDKFGFRTQDFAQTLLHSINFNATFMGGMISFLLFAGGLHINIIDLAKQRWIIGTLATASVVISTFIVGFLVWFIGKVLLHTDIDLIHALIFGALIAPTDPIAVLGILKKIKLNPSLEMKIAGESLFNDGIGIVMFVLLLEISSSQTAIAQHRIAIMFFHQLIGGIAYGALLGYLTNGLLKKVNNYEVSVLITLALVTGGYMLAIKLGVSGPIAMVVSGLIVGAHLKEAGLSTQNKQYLQAFWDVIDEVLNAILFVLIGLAVFQLNFTLNTSLLAIAAIPIVLLARLISVAAPITFFRMFRRFGQNTIRIMTWGGLRGGISIALALSLPDGHIKDEVLMGTYAVVVFSIIVQGLTIGHLIRRSTVKS